MKRYISVWIIISFIASLVEAPQRSYAQEQSNLPSPGTLVNLSPAYVPLLIKGLKVHPENPLLFDFILDTGKSGFKVDSLEFKAESEKLIKYFLASLTIKEDDLWVNLSPYEKNKIIPDQLGQTELGRDMLAQDYILKQLTASLIYPEKQLGKEFWNNVYSKAQKIYGTSQIPVNTFNKVWIIADKAKILERNNVGYVVSAHLKVMLEEDYLAFKKHTPIGGGHLPGGVSTLGSQIVREIIIPELEKEVNQGQNFSPLRQMFYSMILSSWYKLALKNALLNQVYSNRGKTGGVLSDDPTIKEKIYEQYLKAYKKGVFNYIKEDMDTVSKQPIPRKYFSGGERIFQIPPQRLIEREVNLQPGENASPDGDLAMVTADMTKTAQGVRNPDAAMLEVSPADRQPLMALVTYLREMVRVVHEVHPNAGTTLSPISRLLMAIPNILNGALVGKYLELISGEGRSKVFRLGVSDQRHENVTLQIVGSDLVINNNSYTTRYPHHIMMEYYPVIAMVFQAIQSREAGQTLPEPQQPRRIRIERPMGRVTDIDFTQFYAGQQYDQQVSTLLRDWPGFSIDFLADFLKEHGIVSIHAYPDMDAQSRSQGKRILRIFPKTFIENPNAEWEEVNTGGFTIRVQRTTKLIADNIPSIAVLWDERTNEVERIAIHLHATRYDGQFIEITPTMTGFSKLRTELNRLLPLNLGLVRDIPHRHFTWPFVEGDRTSFENTVRSNTYLNFAFRQILNQKSSHPNINLDRGLWIAYDSSVSRQETGGNVVTIGVNAKLLKSLGKQAFRRIDFGVLFHEQLHDLFYLMIQSGNLTNDSLNQILSHIRRAHSNFERWLFSQLAYQQSAERGQQRLVTMITEWISYTSEAVFRNAQQTPIQESSGFSMGSQWRNRITHGDIQLLRSIGFLPWADEGDNAMVTEHPVEGVFGDVKSVWNKIVDLYHATAGQRGVNFIVVIPAQTYNERQVGQQYSIAPGDVIVPGAANEIDYGGWAPMPVVKDRPHHTVVASSMGLPKGTTFRLFIDDLGDGTKTAKIVIVRPDEKLKADTVMIHASSTVAQRVSGQEDKITNLILSPTRSIKDGEEIQVHLQRGMRKSIKFSIGSSYHTFNIYRDDDGNYSLESNGRSIPFVGSSGYFQYDIFYEITTEGLVLIRHGTQHANFYAISERYLIPLSPNTIKKFSIKSVVSNMEIIIEVIRGPHGIAYLTEGMSGADLRPATVYDNRESNIHFSLQETHEGVMIQNHPLGSELLINEIRDHAMNGINEEGGNPLGGIDLNAKNMAMDVAKDGKGIEMKFNPAMIAEFRRGDFSGIVAVILRITPIRSALPILGLEPNSIVR